MTIKIFKIITTISFKIEECNSFISNKKIMRNLKYIAFKINHRLRICRLMMLLMLGKDCSERYLINLGIKELENLEFTIE